ncbi:hypothetical protein KFE25_007923 [Diacronema lutheri]|uniref:Uncharacterized protein n=2 Tax=Diacronema lutheri TaxID=2081491 RepID=A0A8J5XN07_DIALT|nr:hypothetical protein KFE25_007923 [Diacronema lutheri]
MDTTDELAALAPSSGAKGEGADAAAPVEIGARMGAAASAGEPAVALAHDLPPGATELLERLSEHEREMVLDELRGCTPAEQDKVLRQVSDILESGDDAGEHAAEHGGAADGSPAGSDRVPTEDELDELWAQVFDVVSAEDRATIEKALAGRSLAERYDLFLDVEQQLAAAEEEDGDGGDARVDANAAGDEDGGSGHGGGDDRGGNGASPARQRALSVDDATDERDVSALPFDELRERWARAFDRLSDTDQKALLGSIDKQDALGQTRLLLAVEEQLADPAFEHGASIFDGDGDDGYDDDDDGLAGGEERAAHMSDVHDTIRSMDLPELEAEFEACFEMLLERTEPSAEADEDASKLRAEWAGAQLDGKRELLFQMVFCLNNPNADTEQAAHDQAQNQHGGGAEGGAQLADDDDGDALEPREQRQQPHRPQKLGESAGVYRRGGAHDGRSTGGAGAGFGGGAGGIARGAKSGVAGAPPRARSTRLLRVLVPGVLVALCALVAYSRLLAPTSAYGAMPSATWREDFAAVHGEEDS